MYTPLCFRQMMLENRKHVMESIFWVDEWSEPKPVLCDYPVVEAVFVDMCVFANITFCVYD